MATQVAQTGFQTIEEFSDLIVTQFQTPFEAMINDAGQLTEMTTVYTTKTIGTRIPFIDAFKILQQIALNGNPTTETNIATYIRDEVQRWAKAISCSKFEWTDPPVQKLILSQVNALVAMGAWQRTRQIARALSLGETPAYPSYDGQPLFSQNHVVVSNGLSYTNLLPGVALTPTGFNDAKAALQSIPLGEDGTFLPTEMARWLVIVPPQLEMFARLVLRSSTIYESNKFADNPNVNIVEAADLKVSSLLTDPNDWYMAAIYPGQTPFATIQQEEGAPKLIPRISDTDVNVIENNLYLWNFDMAENTIPVHPYQLVKMTNS